MLADSKARDKKHNDEIKTKDNETLLKLRMTHDENHKLTEEL